MKRWIKLAAVVAAAIVLSKLLIENVLGYSLEGIVEAWVTRAGAGSAVTVVTLLAVDLFLPVPSSLVMILSGAAFGVWWGAALSLIGSIGGEWLGFELVRHYGRPLSRRMVTDDEIRTLDRVFARHGVAAIAITRALPVVMETMSVVAGMSRMSRASFLVSSLLGTMPIVVIYAYAGAVSRETGSLVPAVIILIAVAGAGWIWYRSRIAEPSSRRTRRKNGAPNRKAPCDQSNRWERIRSRMAVDGTSGASSRGSDEMTIGPSAGEPVGRPCDPRTSVASSGMTFIRYRNPAAFLRQRRRDPERGKAQRRIDEQFGRVVSGLAVNVHRARVVGRARVVQPVVVREPGVRLRDRDQFARCVRGRARCAPAPRGRAPPRRPPRATGRV